MAQHNELGKKGEQEAVEYLRNQGYYIRETDWRYGHRDLDIIALTPDETTLVIVEVKSRQRGQPVLPEDAVTTKKIKNIAIASDAYMKQFDTPLLSRFDIITVVFSADGLPPDIQHIEDAFNPMLAF